MPSAVVRDRISLDETSLDFRGLTSEELEHHLDELNATLADLRDDGLDVRVHPWLWDGVECLDDTPLCDFLYHQGKANGISRDTRLLLATLLDRCPTWDEGETGCMDAVSIAGADKPEGKAICDPGFSIGVALAKAIAGHAMACLIFPATPRHGFRTVTGPSGAAVVFFFADRHGLCAFWRSIYVQEHVKEDSFFDLAPYAFPRLVLHPLLNFRHFEGHYADIRDKVVAILGAVNDHFSSALEEHAGVPHGVAAAFGSLGVDLSPESPKTRSSPALMAHRMVNLDGENYLCEWHAKLEPHRNRIHFSLPVAGLDGRIVVGRFTIHLPT